MSYVERNLRGALLEAARVYPVVTVTGPRQSGKTTLCRAAFPGLSYVSLEPFDNREFARSDPRGFLAAHAGGAIIDEVQNAPDLASYLQVEVDARPRPGRFVLTGSQHLGLSATVSQSLAGRTAVRHLLPFALDEVRRFNRPPTDLFDTLWRGGYPRIHDQGIPAGPWLGDYIATYVERDVRQVLNIGDLVTFAAFARLAAGRTTQELNLSRLGSDAGTSHVTARSWLSVLEATFLCSRVPAMHRNVRKQVVKAAKLHWFDSGLVCRLLGILSPEQLFSHPQRGAVFESWVFAEVYKHLVNRAAAHALYHYRETRGAEIDLVVDSGDHLALVEAKSGATVGSDWLQPLVRLRDALVAGGERRSIELYVVYGGDEPYERQGVRIVPWWRVPETPW